MSKRTLVVVATFNEAENLPVLVDDIFRYAPNVDVLVVDDNSPDGTGDWCEEYRIDEPRLFCLHRTGKLGLGTALVAGMRFAMENGYRYVMTMDADFSHPPVRIPAMLYGMDAPGRTPVDCMIGSRYIPGGGVEGWPWKRHFMSRGVNFYTRWLLALKPKDCSGGFRCYRVSALEKLDFDRIRSQGYSLQEEILWRLKCSGAKFGETPIVFTDRQRGQSKITLNEAVSAVRIIFSLRMEAMMGR